MLSQRSSMVIDAMRFPLIVLVIYAHIPSCTTQNLDNSSWLYQLYLIISENISFIFARITISFFFLISGYFLFYSIDNLKLTNKLKKRIKTILAPYILWNVITLAIICIKHSVFDMIGLSNENDKVDTSIYNIFWSGPINYPLWYIRDLICMFIISPLIYILIKKLPLITISTLTCLYVCGVNTNIPGLSIIAIYFFTIGSFLGFKKQDFVEWCNKNFDYLLILTLVLLVTLNIFQSQNIYEPLKCCFTIVSIASTTSIFCRLSDKRLASLCKLSASVFFIYATHEIYILNWAKGFFAHYIGFTPTALLICYFIQPIIVIIFCFALYKYCVKCFPKTLSFMTGGRI